MELGTYILRQMEGVNAALRGLIADVSAEEWCSAAGPGMNPVGFTAWHVASIQDWAINTWMRNRETVRSRPEWVARGMMTSFLPFGMSLDTAFELARATSPTDVLAYADAVLEDAGSLLATLSADAFDEVPANKAHLADPRYNQPGYLNEVADMYEQPYWRLFSGACSGHCRGHLGELELALSIMRGG